MHSTETLLHRIESLEDRCERDEQNFQALAAQVLRVEKLVWLSLALQLGLKYATELTQLFR